MIFWATRYSATFVPPSPSSVTFSPAVFGGLGVDTMTLEPALATPTSSASTPISASVNVVTSFFLAAMMPLKDGKRGSLIFSLTETTAGSGASTVKTPSSVSRSPVTLPPSTDTLRRWVNWGRPRYSAITAGTAPPTPSVASLPAMTSSVPSMVPSARASAQRQGLADGLGRALGAGCEHCHSALSAVGGFLLLDQKRLFDGPLVDLVEHGVGGLTVEGEIAVGQLALRPRVWDLFDQDHDVRHDSGSSSSERPGGRPAVPRSKQLPSCYSPVTFGGSHEHHNWSKFAF